MEIAVVGPSPVLQPRSSLLLPQGISYTNFTLSWSPAPPAANKFSSLNQVVNYTVTVKNVGHMDGDEVVFGYFHPNKTSLRSLPRANPVPFKQLFDYQRVHVAAGQSVQVVLTLNSTALGLVDLDGHRSLHPGVFGIEINRGHGEPLMTTTTVEVEEPIRISTFRKWW